jgi:hypothetical protein
VNVLDTDLSKTLKRRLLKVAGDLEQYQPYMNNASTSSIGPFTFPYPPSTPIPSTNTADLWAAIGNLRQEVHAQRNQLHHALSILVKQLLLACPELVLARDTPLLKAYELAIDALTITSSLTEPTFAGIPIQANANVPQNTIYGLKGPGTTV